MTIKNFRLVIVNLYDENHDLELVAKHLGLSKYTVQKQLLLLKLSKRLTATISIGKISDDIKVAETSVVHAVKAVNLTSKSSEEETEKILKIAKNFAIENSSED